MTWWDREDSALAPVVPVERCVCAIAIRSKSSFTLFTRCSVSPGSCTCGSVRCSGVKVGENVTYMAMLNLWVAQPNKKSMRPIGRLENWYKPKQ